MLLWAMFKNLSRLTFWQFRQVIRLWNRHGCVDLSAAFAFHSLQSIFPFLLLCFGVAARVFGQADGAFEQILDFADQVLPPGSRFVIADVLETLIGQGRAAGIIGAFALLITDSNATLSLQRGYDRLWLGLRSHCYLIIPGFGTLAICYCKGLKLFLAHCCLYFYY